MAPKNGIQDAVDKVVPSAHEGEPPRMEMVHIPVTISSTNRPAALEIPADCTDAELGELVLWIGSSVRATMAQQRAQRAHGGLTVVRGMPQGLPGLGKRGN